MHILRHYPELAWKDCGKPRIASMKVENVVMQKRVRTNHASRNPDLFILVVYQGEGIFKASDSGLSSETATCCDVAMLYHEVGRN